MLAESNDARKQECVDASAIRICANDSFPCCVICEDGGVTRQISVDAGRHS